MEPIPLNVLSHIDEDFEESDLPFKVDVVNYLTCDKNFQNMIKKDLILLSMGPHGDLLADLSTKCL
jgi:type I restriction enzyme S subunit